MLTCKGSFTATVWKGPGTGGGAGVADPWGWRRGKDENGTPDQAKQSSFTKLDCWSWLSPEVLNMSWESFMLNPSSVLSHVLTEAVLLLLRRGSHIQETISEDETAFSLLTNKSFRWKVVKSYEDEYRKAISDWKDAFRVGFEAIEGNSRKCPAGWDELVRLWLVWTWLRSVGERMLNIGLSQALHLCITGQNIQGMKSKQ